MIIPTRLSILNKFWDKNHLPTTLRKHSEADLWNRQDLFCATEHWNRVQWKPDWAFMNLCRLSRTKFTISLSMQLPLSPLFPFVSSTDSKQSIRTSPGLIFICLKKGKNNLSSKDKAILFPASLSSVFCSVHHEKWKIHTCTHTYKSILHTWHYHYISQMKNINVFIIKL